MKAKLKIKISMTAVLVIVVQSQLAMANPPTNCSAGQALDDYNAGLTDYMNTTCAAVSQTMNMVPNCTSAETRAQFSAGFLVMRATIAYVKARSACSLNTLGAPNNPQLCDGYTNYSASQSTSYVPEGVWNYDPVTNPTGLFTLSDLNSTNAQSIFQTRLTNVLNYVVSPALVSYQAQGAACGALGSNLWNVLPYWSSDILQSGVYG